MDIQYNDQLLINVTREEALQKGVPEAVIAAAEERDLMRIEVAESQSYLRSTDWYVTRFAETGEAVPQDVTDARAAARLTISNAQV